MSRARQDTISRLRRANPALVQDDRGRGVVAQAALEGILRDVGEATAPRRRARRRFSPRNVAVGFAMMAIGTGGAVAVAATNPFGWWSSNPNQAMFAVNSAVHVRTPAARLIRCRVSVTGGLRCTAEKLVCASNAAGQMSCAGPANGTGQAYEKLSAVPSPAAASLLSRASFLAQIARGVSHGTITPAHAAKFREDLADVPDSFFTELRLASRFNTIGTGSAMDHGQALVPPAGVPEIIVCEDAGRALACRNLNGDESAPVGAGVYGAQAGRGWRVASSHRPDTGLPSGIKFTAEEYRVLRDLVEDTAVTRSSSTGSRHPAPSRS